MNKKINLKSMTRNQKLIFARAVLDELRAATDQRTVRELTEELGRRGCKEVYAADKIIRIFQFSILTLILGAFEWMSSEKGYDYWQKVSVKWTEYCYKNSVESVIANIERNYQEAVSQQQD